VDASRAPSPLYVIAFVVLLAVGVLKMFAALSPMSPLDLVWVSAVGYLFFPALVIFPLIQHGTKNIRGSRAAAVLTSVVVTGGIGMYAVSWASSQNSRKMQTADVQKMYATIENAMPLRVGLAAIVLILAIWGLLAFLTAAAPEKGTDGTFTLFGAHRR
jgi:hypothetical protein